MAVLVALRTCEEMREECERRTLEAERIHVSNQNTSDGKDVAADSEFPYIKITVSNCRKIIPIREGDYCGPPRLPIAEEFSHAWEICDYLMLVHRENCTSVMLIDQNTTAMILQCNSQMEAHALFERIVQTVKSARRGDDESDADEGDADVEVEADADDESEADEGDAEADDESDESDESDAEAAEVDADEDEQ